MKKFNLKMNKKDFVTYEQALILKKLGFRNPCLYHYNVDAKLSSNYMFFNDMIRTEDIYRHYNSNLDIELPVDAPTLAQIQKWLLKEKNIYVNAIYNNNEWIGCWDNVKNGTYDSCDEIFNSPEEALSAIITKCLEFLENE